LIKYLIGLLAKRLHHLEIGLIGPVGHHQIDHFRGQLHVGHGHESLGIGVRMAGIENQRQLGHVINDIGHFYAGQLATLGYGRWVLPNLKKLKGDVDYDIAPLPSEDGKTVMPVGIYTAAMAVNAKAKDKDAALRFLGDFVNVPVIRPPRLTRDHVPRGLHVGVGHYVVLYGRADHRPRAL
jgi:hypothetical protein